MKIIIKSKQIRYYDLKTFIKCIFFVIAHYVSKEEALSSGFFTNLTGSPPKILVFPSKKIVLIDQSKGYKLGQHMFSNF